MRFSPPEHTIHAIQWRHRLVFGGLGLVCALVFASFYVMLDMRAHDAEALNLAGRQRMLAQQIGLFALQAEDSTVSVHQAEVFQAIHGVTDEMARVQALIEAGAGPFRGLVSVKSKEILHGAPYFLDERMNRFLTAARELAASDPEHFVHGDARVQAIVGHSTGSLLSAFDALLTQMAADSRERLGNMTTTAGFSLAFIPFLLLFSQSGVFRPLFGRLGASMREAALLRHAIEQSSAAVLISDAGGRIEYVNPAFCRMTGYEVTAVIGQTPALLQSGLTDPRVYQNLWQAITKGQDWNGEILNRRRDGSLYWESMIVSPLRATSGEITHFVAFKEEITERKAHERELVTARAAAEDADRAKSAFLAQMSHDLRTPLNAVIGFADMIRGQFFGPLGSPRYQEYAGHIQDSGRQMLAFVDDLLELASIEADRVVLNRQPILLPQAVSETLAALGPILQERIIDLDGIPFGNIPPLDADGLRLHQTLINLLSHAVKLTPPDGRITLRAETDPEAPFVILRISDNGSGIAPERLPHVFDPFRQSHHPWESASHETGLGLPLVKRLVEMHGGGVAIHSTLGAGTTVRLRWPIAIN